MANRTAQRWRARRSGNQVPSALVAWKMRNKRTSHHEARSFLRAFTRKRATRPSPLPLARDLARPRFHAARFSRALRVFALSAACGTSIGVAFAVALVRAMGASWSLAFTLLAAAVIVACLAQALRHTRRPLVSQPIFAVLPGPAART
jgi:hypothetical protein